MFSDVEIVTKKYIIPNLLDIRFVTLFWDINIYKTFKYPEMANILLFFISHLL